MDHRKIKNRILIIYYIINEIRLIVPLSILSQILLKGGILMKVEDYLRIYNRLARWIGFTPIERVDGPHEKGKTYNQVKINTFPFLISR